MLELSRRGGRTPENPLTQPGTARIGLKIAAGAFVVLLVGLLTYDRLNRPANPPAPVAAASAPAPVRAPYAGVRSDQADPSVSGLERGREGASARFAATGGMTANSSALQTSGGRVTVDVTGMNMGQGTDKATYEAAVHRKMLELSTTDGLIRGDLRAPDRRIATLDAARDRATKAVAALATAASWRDEAPIVEQSLANYVTTLQVARNDETAH
jgi:hypothetical protein